MRLLLGLICLLLCPLLATAEDIVDEFPAAAYRARVAIIIDDVGYGLKQGQALAESPHALTIAIIPFTPHGREIAKMAHRNNKEVMLHAPMEPLHRTRWEAGLTASMDEAEIQLSLDKMLNNIPHVAGVNNHGGSKFTQDKDRMRWLMSSLADRDLFFIDSRTIASSAARYAADAEALPHASRDVFLDNSKEPARIRQQLDKLRAIASRTGQAIAIGHPHDTTMDAIVEELPRFYRTGIELVSASKLLKVDHIDVKRQKNVNNDKLVLSYGAKID